MRVQTRGVYGVSAPPPTTTSRGNYNRTTAKGAENAHPSCKIEYIGPIPLSLLPVYQFATKHLRCHPHSSASPGVSPPSPAHLTLFPQASRALTSLLPTVASNYFPPSLLPSTATVTSPLYSSSTAASAPPQSGSPGSSSSNPRGTHATR